MDIELGLQKRNTLCEFLSFLYEYVSERESIKANPWRFFEELIKRQPPATVCGVPESPTYRRLSRNRCGVPSSILTESLTGFLSGPCNPTRKRSTTSVLVQRGSYQVVSELRPFLVGFSYLSFFKFWFFHSSLLFDSWTLFIVLEPFLNIKWCSYVIECCSC